MAVANTFPLGYLVAADHAELLVGLFGVILIPTGVAGELADRSAPVSVRHWIAQPPAWLRIHTLCSPRDAELMAALDRGEREAIQLTSEQKVDVLIMDERRGRAIARRRGLPLIGALGVLGNSYQRALIHHPLKILADMRKQGFRISDKLVQSSAAS